MCEACTKALTDPNTGFQENGCRGCQVRAMSKAPNFIRAAYYDTIPDPEERKQFAQDVTAEWNRRQALRRATT